MPIAALLTLAETYGPTIFSLLVTYGPKIYGALEPLVAASIANGTLEQDIAALVAKVEAVAPLLGELTSVADIADAIGSIQPAAVESPAMERVTGSKAR